MHCLLFGSHMAVNAPENGPRTLHAKLRRYWNQPLWNRFFHTLLNASEWPSTLRAPWETLLDDLHDFLSLQGSSSVRSTLVQQLSMLPNKKTHVD